MERSSWKPNETGKPTPVDLATSALLASPDSAAQKLLLADKYMQAYTDDPIAFALPDQYAGLKPIIERYANDLGGFVDYIRAVRDTFEKDTLPWTRIQKVYRRIMGRHTQQVRRERSDRACAKALELYGPAPFHDRLCWVAKLEHDWARRRLEYLARHRRKKDNNRLGSDERAELLERFWQVIDAEIDRGEIPPWKC